MTHEEANAILNRFLGWVPGQKCDGYKRCRWLYTDPRSGNNYHPMRPLWSQGIPYPEHDIPPFDYFAEETPELYWRMRLLKNEFVRRTHQDLTVDTYIGCDSEIHFAVNIGKEVYEIESHAIAFAIAAALKERAS